MFRGRRLKCYTPSRTVTMYPWYGISHDREASGNNQARLGVPLCLCHSGRGRGGLLLFQRFHLLVPIPPIPQLIFYLLSTTYILTVHKFIPSSSYLVHPFPGSGPACRTIPPVECQRSASRLTSPVSPLTFTNPDFWRFYPLAPAPVTVHANGSKLCPLIIPGTPAAT